MVNVAVPPATMDPPPVTLISGTSEDLIVVSATVGFPRMYPGPGCSWRTSCESGWTNPLSRVGTCTSTELAPGGMVNGPAGGSTSSLGALPPSATLKFTGTVLGLDA